MKGFIFGLGLGIIFLISVALATDTVNQGQPGRFGPWFVGGRAATGTAVVDNPVLIGGSDGTNMQNAFIESTNKSLYVAPLGQVYTPGIPTNVSTSTGSAAATGLTVNGCYRVTCTADTYFRTGTGTPTAVTTDSPIWAKTIERMCLQSGHTAFAFINAAGTGTCSVSAVPLKP